MLLRSYSASCKQVATIVFGFVLSLTISRLVRAQESTATIIPVSVPNCRVTAPPASSGLFVTPGGFAIVYPRNASLTDTYTGCKTLWIADTDRTPRLATLVFERGILTRAIAHDVRDANGAVEGACAFPEGRSLMPNAGRKLSDAACRGFTGEPLYALKVPTYPRSCLTKPNAPECVGDPK